MNLRQLEILRAVMQFRTTVGAGHELGMSQPAVSTAIKHMESQLGFPLFDRLSNRLVPTEEARLLAAESEPLFRSHRSVRQFAADLKAGGAGRIRLAATAELSDALLPPVMAAFAAARPHVKLGLETLARDDVLDAVETGGADLGFAMEPSARPGVVLEPIAELEMVCVCRPDDPIGRLPFVTPVDLRGAGMVGSLSGTRIAELVAGAFRAAAEAFVPPIEVRFMNAAVRLVAAGYGVSVVDPLTARAAAQTGAVVARRFKPRIPLNLCVVLPKDRPPSRLASLFLVSIREAVRAEQFDTLSEL